ncbi:cytochrome c [Nitrosomonas sp.]|uniref:c-type cytochrome n=1 Tax=Nitrosomonas sp. TaxID=42353 RepID=UPI002730762D|nr:cytochrome c [Nitrosomonas sp.]MDP1788264.1 cytochrome c [Nitrosomonas sp.]MDP2224173.1 cytochrome c [Nitrosomonas sp.]
MEKTKLENWLFGFLFTVIFVTSTAWSAQEEKNTPGFAWKDGAEIYTKICAYCHEAHVGPQIRNRDLPAAYIRAVVRNGNRAMPAFRPSEIDDESLVKLADFISNKDAQR